MGVNNRQRRATKAKQRAKERRARDGVGGAYGHGPHCPSGCGELDEREVANLALLIAVHAVSADPASAEATAADLVAVDHGRRLLLATEAAAMGGALVAALTGEGWTPGDLGQVLRRRIGAGAAAVVAGALRSQATAVAPERVAPEWQAQLGELPPSVDLDLTAAPGLARLLRVLVELQTLPPLAVTTPPPGRYRASAASAAAGDDTARQLARVRALLAKAESTTYEAEAEALTAKAQELIARHALERLLARADQGAPAPSVIARRLWIDAPYVMAKGILVNAVAGANRCRAVISEDLGCVHLVGDPRDLADVELLATSLLVQADAAMLRHGRQQTRAGMSRTRSFRQAFLVSYATRIGERLRAASESTLAEAAPERLLPVLRRAGEQVDREFARLFPETVEKATPVRDARGWAAGRAAADLALLDINGQVAAAG